MARSGDRLSVYLSYLLRHHPEDAQLTMDEHGWVSVEQLIENVNRGGKYALDAQTLRQIVETDAKGRYRYSQDGAFIRCCQGHSIPWVAPELAYGPPPDVLYHGTTTDAYRAILQSGGISRRARHAVHLSASREIAWLAATRWHQQPVLLRIDARRMHADGFRFGESDNHVWCTRRVPAEYILAAESL